MLIYSILVKLKLKLKMEALQLKKFQSLINFFSDKANSRFCKAPLIN